MYLYKAIDSESKPRSKEPLSYIDKTINNEIITSTLARLALKDLHSSKLNVKGPKQAEAAHKAEVQYFRKQINSFPEGLRENARSSYLLDQNIKRKDLQEYQCTMIGKLESILRKNMTDNGQDYRKFKVGGFDGGTYEKFFRIEPARYMSKAQLSTALRKLFGDNIIQASGSIDKLFDSYDFYHADQMDWRAFLYLLTIIMQPHMPCRDLIRWAYAIYSSCGSLDLECKDKLSLGMIKDMLCVPVLLSMRSEVKNMFDQAWYDISNHDTETIEYTAKVTGSKKFILDPDDFKINYKIFQKIMTQTKFAKNLEVCLYFGSRDLREWTSTLEEHYYHPIVLQKMKDLRREMRNTDECEKFIALSNHRKKDMMISMWRKFVYRRNQLRWCLIACEIRSRIGVFGTYFDHWKKLTIEISRTIMLQRCIRGLIARRRRHFMYRIKHKVVVMQSGTRQLLTKLKYKKQQMRIYWAITTIQRIVRGKLARLRVANIVEETYDTRRRHFLQQTAQWYWERTVRAALSIQMAIRRWLRRRRTMHKLEQQRLIAETEQEIKDQLEQARIADNLYRQQITQYFKQRKIDYEHHCLDDKHSAEQKKIILSRKNKARDTEREEQKRKHEEKMTRVEEERIEMWIKAWEYKIEQRGKARRKKCKNCLLIPETPDDIKLKKELLVKIKKNVKEVLRRADKQKIPMEMPEAHELSTNEMIEAEVQAEIARARQEMREEAEKLQAEEEEKQKKLYDAEKAAKRRKMKWGLLTIQKYARAFLSRKRLRSKAYDRFTKMFDPASLEYFYIDKRTKKASWNKPKALGSYDIKMDNYWMVIPDNRGGRADLSYYYNPSTWDQTWDQPKGTVMCSECNQYFAMAYLNQDQRVYCETCFHQAVHNLRTNGMKADHITFKKFDGNKSEAEYVDFYYIQDSIYSLYMISLDPNLRLTEEEEEIENQLKAKREQNKQRSKSSVFGYCQECHHLASDLRCEECNMNYCQSCFNLDHYKIPNADTHTITELKLDSKYLSLPDIYAKLESDSNSSKSKKKKKKRSKSKEKKKKDHGNQSEGEDTAATSGSKHSKHKKKDKSSSSSHHKKHSKSKSRATTPGTGGRDGLQSEGESGFDTTGGGAMSELSESDASPDRKKDKKDTKHKHKSKHHHSDTEKPKSSQSTDRKSKHKKHYKSHHNDGGVTSATEGEEGESNYYDSDVTGDTAGKKKKHHHKKHHSKHHHMKDPHDGESSDLVLPPIVKSSSVNNINTNTSSGGIFEKEKKHKKHHHHHKKHHHQSGEESGNDASATSKEKKKKKKHKEKENEQEEENY